MGCISVTAKRTGGIRITCALVCSIRQAKFLEVKPEYIFLMPGNNFTDDVLVRANVVWKAE